MLIYFCGCVFNQPKQIILRDCFWWVYCLLLNELIITLSSWNLFQSRNFPWNDSQTITYKENLLSSKLFDHKLNLVDYRLQTLRELCVFCVKSVDTMLIAELDLKVLCKQILNPISFHSFIGNSLQHWLKFKIT